MSTSLSLIEGDYTRFNSDIKVCRSSADVSPNVYLSSKDDVNSYFNNIVQFNQNIIVNGTIINTDISSMKNKVTYMNVDTVNLINTTTFLSHINICDPEDPGFIPAIHLSSTTGYSYFVNNVNFYKDVTIGGLIINTALSNDISTISGKIKYITSTDIDTVLNSRLKITNINLPTDKSVMLSNDTTDTSYIKSDLKLHQDLNVVGNITNTELNNNTTNVASISGKIQYVTCTNGDTIVNSSIYVKDFNSSQYVCKFANGFDQLSYIRSNLTISGNVSISGTITNTEVNNATTNINTISGLVNTNKLNITTLSGLVNTISGHISNNNNSAITVTGDALNGYTITIGNALSSVYINGNLYYNNDLLFKKATSEGNQVGIQEYINQL